MKFDLTTRRGRFMAIFRPVLLISVFNVLVWNLLFSHLGPPLYWVLVGTATLIWGSITYVEVWHITRRNVQ